MYLMRTLSDLVCYILCLLTISISNSFAEFPQDLDSFLGLLFETEKCESFISDSTYLAVSTRNCKPNTCDFPRQICMRAADLYKEEKANECRRVPEECLVAANSGEPLPSLPPKPATPLPKIGQFPNIPDYIAKNTAPRPEISSQIPPVQPPTVQPPVPVIQPSGGTRPSRPHEDICRQGIPEGRFCGFTLKFAYNMETGNCEQFWFPGCRTDNVNNNLFDKRIDCIKAISHCSHKAHATPPTTIPSSRVEPPHTRNDEILLRPVNAGFGPSKEVRNEEWSTNNNAGTGSGGGMGGGFAPMQQWLGTLNNGMGGNGGGGIGGAGNNGQNGGGSGASNFVRLITNTLREVSKGPAENTVSGNGGQMLSGINNLFGGGGGGNSGGQFGNIGQLISAIGK